MKDTIYSSYSIPAPKSIKNRIPLGRHLLKHFKSYLYKLKNWGIFLSPVGFLLGRASLIGEIAPFGAIFWLLLLRERPRESYLVAGTVLLGRVSTQGWSVAGLLFFSMFLVWFWEALCLRYWNKKSPLILSAFLLVIAGNPILFQAVGGSYQEFFILFLKITVGLLAAYAFLPAIKITKKLPFIRDRPELNPDETMAMVLLLSLALLGTGQLEIAGLGIIGLVSKMVLLFTAYLAGAAWGAAAGIITGTILGLGNPQIYMFIGSLSFSGFWAGYMRQFGKWGSGLAFIISAPALTVISSSDLKLVSGPEDLLVLGVFLLIPAGWWNKLKPYSPENIQFVSGKETGGKELKNTSRQLSEIMYELSLVVTQQNKSNNLDIKSAELISDITSRCCSSCMLYKRCWEYEIYGNTRAILKLVSEKEGVIKPKDLPSGIRNRCNATQQLIESINCSKELWQANCFWQDRLKEGRELVAYQLKGVSQVIQDISRELKDDESTFLQPVEKNTPFYTLEIGIAQNSIDGKEVCGDYYTCSEISENHQMIIISDGMGSGSPAFQESKTTVSLLDKMIRAGFPRELVAKTLNSMLQLSNPEEVFATVDMTLLDLTRGEVEWIKAGGAPSYCKRGAEVKKIGSGSLPLGILSELDLEFYYEKLFPHDILVMVSDGVLASAGDWIPSFLSQYEHKHPQIIADRLLEEAERRNGEPDDKTVVACRLLPLKNTS